ncbi:DUF2169 family type VI secretion system accessory protein [Pseudoduganella albidiflava]|nr:DUF2169 domain-containing protein [Pseudoduganella albidiflava]GGY45217.1 hypothetical protein GCM10007387_29020 [Pseudoduganella albidiflava]
MAALPDFPSLRFRNDTDFDALHFDTLDQHDVPFHVIAAKTGYTLGPCGSDGLATLVPLDSPAPLHQQDRHYDDDVDCSVRAESDLAPYKPRCDVIVVGDACAPGGRAAASFPVALRVQYPDQPLPAPEPPRPLNPFQPVSPAAQQRWRAQAEQAARQVVPGRRLIDKVLQVTGSRQLRRRTKALGLLRPATLGAIGSSPWKLTQPAPALRVPVRYEVAQGGQVIVEGNSAAAERVPQRWRLSAAQQAQYGHMEVAPAAHDACQANPAGRGFAPAWYLDAANPASLPAPQVGYPGAPFTADLFWAACRGKAGLTPAGFGFVGRAWLPRRELAGTVDGNAAWDADDVPRLPPDFDFAYWNGAPADQQCDHLTGKERFTLVNMLPHDAPSVRIDGDGNSVLAFTLPAQALFALAAGEDGAVAAMPLAIDTVLIDTLAGTVELTWRLCLVADGRFADARLLHAHTPEQLDRLALWNEPADTAGDTQPAVPA